VYHHVEAVSVTFSQMLLTRFRIEIRILNYEKGSTAKRENRQINTEKPL
jgi:hypothetical protein